MNAENVVKSQKSVIVNPNLGRPLFLTIDPKLKTKKFQAEILLISSILEPDEFEGSIKNDIQIVPVLDYQWKLRKMFSKIKFKPGKKELKEEGKRSRDRKKERKLKKKKRKLFARELKDDERLQDFRIDDVDYKLKKLRVRPFRGGSKSPQILEVKEVPTISIHHMSYLDILSPQDYLLKQGIFDKLDKFYLVRIGFNLSKEVKKFLKERNFVMFDLILSKKRINYHSIVISKQEWKNFTFIHATDLHLAERNDRIYGIIKKWTESSIRRSVDDFITTISKKLKLKKLKQDQERFLSEIKIPLRKRFINPNNQFKKFIKLMNRKILKNELDFIVLTGDLVDYTVLSRLSKKVRKINEFNYEESNWQTFKNILLNSTTQKNKKGVIKGEELLCPIFTIVGNHDYRPYHYDITWAEMYKKVGLNAAEAIALNELFSASPISAMVKTPMALKGYLSEINPSLDFFLTLGKNNFIFLNTGSDSFKNVRDLIMGHPSVTGLLNKQIVYLENLINNKIKKEANIFLFLHGPPINTGSKKISIKIFEKKGKRILKTKLLDFKESLIKKLGQAPSKARIDGAFNVKYGSISSNWEKLMKFCKDYTIMTLCGHTHMQREFRLEDPEIKTKVYDAPPFSIRKIENPAAVFYDDYSEIYTDAESIRKNGPFVVQTPGLGLGGYKNPETAGAYREIIVKDGRLTSFRVKYINR